ncbi:hypothetical protein VRU48_03015 [Pedobacter sp. KR3-3]|uniref:ABC transporter permease n=1 Tax=Pedobacter albus TaxID=3113905 RepID=A0ABU7I3S6_9SPHI|nr:hypothetical protein [Pedobacter sp. KR3-3]MEE1944062.1 hypothetical protein [Pedobacter sp. KR3-3]
MLKLLYKTIGRTFYQQYAGLFLVVFYLLFGAVEGSQLISYHEALLLAFCASPLALLLLLGIWILYALKCAFFVRQQLKQENFVFANNITVLRKNSQLWVWVKVYALLLLPILGYALLLLFMALRHGHYLTFMAVSLFLPLLLLLLARYTFNQHNYAFKTIQIWVKLPMFKVKRPFWTWPLFYLLNEQRLMLILCKVVSFVFLKGMLWMFADVGPDSRVYLTAAMTVVLSHSVVLLNLVKSEANYLSFAKGLPIATFNKLLHWLGVVCLLLLPEMILFVWLVKFDWAQCFAILLYLPSAMICLLALVYWLKANMDHYLKCLLFFFFVSMWMILAGQYLVFSLLLLALGSWAFLWKYNRIDLREIA